MWSVVRKLWSISGQYFRLSFRLPSSPRFETHGYSGDTTLYPGCKLEPRIKNQETRRVLLMPELR